MYQPTSESPREFGNIIIGVDSITLTSSSPPDNTPDSAVSGDAGGVSQIAVESTTLPPSSPPDNIPDSAVSGDAGGVSQEDIQNQEYYGEDSATESPGLTEFSDWAESDANITDAESVGRIRGEREPQQISQEDIQNQEHHSEDSATESPGLTEFSDWADTDDNLTDAESVGRIRGEREPQQREREPQQREREPQQRKRELQQIEREPQQMERGPQQMERGPQQMEREPQQMEREPQQREFTRTNTEALSGRRPRMLTRLFRRGSERRTRHSLERQQENIELQPLFGLYVNSVRVPEPEDDTVSIAKFGGDPWHTLRPKIERFLDREAERRKFPREHMRFTCLQGDRESRLVSITFKTIQKPPQMSWRRVRHLFWPYLKKHEYILSICRNNEEMYDREFAVLMEIEHHGRGLFPVPSVVSFDTGAINIFGAKCAIRTPVEGNSVEQLWRLLSREQKVSLAEEITIFQLKLMRITASCCYEPRLLLDPASGVQLCTLPIPPRKENDAVRYKEPGFVDRETVESTFTFLRDTCWAWARREQLSGRNVRPQWEHIDRIVTEAEKAGLLPQWHGFHLTHLELLPKNIYIRTTFGSSKVEITGVLGWKHALYAPLFVACQPAAAWLWRPNGYDADETDWSHFRPSPGTYQASIREAVERILLPEYHDMAFQWEYVKLRKCFKVLRDGSRPPINFW